MKSILWLWAKGNNDITVSVTVSKNGHFKSCSLKYDKNIANNIFVNWKCVNFCNRVNLIGWNKKNIYDWKLLLKS